MAKNHLFSFIKEISIIKHKTKVFQLQVSAKNQELVIHHLEMNLGSIVAKSGEILLKLTAHHISCFERLKKNHPKFTQYHYTADLQDQKNKRYKLHVYFNENDIITTAPEVVEINEQNNPEKLVFPELSETFGQLAIDYSRSIMSDIKQQHQEEIQKLLGIYNELENKLVDASRNLVVRPDIYLDLLEQVIDSLTKLCQFQNHKKLLNLFGRIRETFTANIDSKTPKEMQEPETEQPIRKLREADPSKNIASKKTLAIALFILELTKLHRNYLNTKSQPCSPKTIEEFLVLHAKVYETLFLSESTEYYSSHDDLMTMQNLMTFTQSEGKRLLETQLLVGNFELASKLKSFTHLLPENMIKLALTHNRYTLLAFILSNGNFALNTMLIESNLTPVLYCFLKHSNKTPKVECLSVLIKYGASIMIKHEGLPLAYYILEFDNGLKKSLIDNSNLTLARRGFFSSLIQHLDTYLLTSSNEDGREVRVKNVLARYQGNLSLNTETLKFIDSRGVAQAETNLANLGQHFQANDIEQLSNDPEIKSLRLRYTETLDNYLKMLPPSQIRGLLREGNEVLDNLNKHLGDKKLDITAMRQQIKDFLTYATQMMQLLIELLNVQKSLRVPKYSRQLNKLKTQEMQIIAKMKILQFNNLAHSKYFGIILETEQHSKELHELAKMICIIDSKIQSLYSYKTKFREFGSIVSEATITNIDNMQKYWIKTRVNLQAGPVNQEGMNLLLTLDSNLNIMLEKYKSITANSLSFSEFIKTLPSEPETSNSAANNPNTAPQSPTIELVITRSGFFTGAKTTSSSGNDGNTKANPCPGLD